MIRFALIFASLLLCGSTVYAFPEPTAAAGDWPWWRGPSRNGIADSSNDVPVEWSETKNVIWKVPIPGRGHSSPTIVGNRIYLTTADEKAQVQSVIALDRASGKRVWKTDINQGGFPPKHRKNTHATPTVASDGNLIFAAFHHHDQVTLSAINLKGKEVWKKVVGPYAPKRYPYGYAPSPCLYESLVIVAADYEQGGHLVAYNREDGELVWRTDRPKTYSFSSPTVANIAGKDQLLLCGGDQVNSYDPKTGKELWTTPGTTMATSGTVVWSGDLVFASGGYPKAETICVKADGSGEVWKNNQSCYEQSLIALDGYIYCVTDRGIGYCWRASDGREMWKQRLASPVASSPVSVGDVIYQTIEDGTTFVFKANPDKYEPIAKNKLGEEGFATLSIAGDRIYLRTAKTENGQRQEYLYFLGLETGERGASAP